MSSIVHSLEREEHILGFKDDLVDLLNTDVASDSKIHTNKLSQRCTEVATGPLAAIGDRPTHEDAPNLRRACFMSGLRLRYDGELNEANPRHERDA